jgi:hypothetical protein
VPGQPRLPCWIAQSITEEHAAALEWLNENTIADVGFFGIELEVLKIGDSLPAPAGGTWPPWPGLRMR